MVSTASILDPINNLDLAIIAGGGTGFCHKGALAPLEIWLQTGAPLWNSYPSYWVWLKTGYPQAVVAYCLNFCSHSGCLLGDYNNSFIFLGYKKLQT